MIVLLLLLVALALWGLIVDWLATRWHWSKPLEWTLIIVGAILIGLVVF